MAKSTHQSKGAVHEPGIELLRQRALEIDLAEFRALNWTDRTTLVMVTDPMFREGCRSARDTELTKRHKQLRAITKTTENPPKNMPVLLRRLNSNGVPLAFSQEYLRGTVALEERKTKNGEAVLKFNAVEGSGFKVPPLVDAMCLRIDGELMWWHGFEVTATGRLPQTWRVTQLY